MINARFPMNKHMIKLIEKRNLNLSKKSKIENYKLYKNLKNILKESKKNKISKNKVKNVCFLW